MSIIRLYSHRFLMSFWLVTWLLYSFQPAVANSLSDRYNSEHPLVIVGDWDKAPYEFLNDKGIPSGINVDLLTALCDEMDIPYKFVLKEWSAALKTFERNNADIILANGHRYRNKGFYVTDNIIYYDRLCVAAYNSTEQVFSLDKFAEEGIVLKPADYTAFFFSHLDTLNTELVAYQSPKVALQGLVAGDYKYFIWGEEPLKWKLMELNLEGVTLHDVALPVNEIHIIGRDRELIYELDDLFSRMKQSGEVQRISDTWLHPERVNNVSYEWVLYVLLGILLLGILFYVFNRIAKAHVRAATRQSSELNNMMSRALHMGDYHVLEYDIRRDVMINLYGEPILPEKGITLKEFTERIHPNEVDEFTRKIGNLLCGRERKFELKKRWRSFGQDGRWLNLEGHAIVELDEEGRPAYIVNAINDTTHDDADDCAARELDSKYTKLTNQPFAAVSFYDKDGWLLELNDTMKAICGISDDATDIDRFWHSVGLFDIPIFRGSYKHGDRHILLGGMHMDMPDIGINRFMEYEVQPLIDRAGNVLTYFVTAMDRTGEHDVQAELLRLDRQLEMLNEQINQQKNRLAYLLQRSDCYLIRTDLERKELLLYRSPDHPEYVHRFDEFCDDYLNEPDRTAFGGILSDDRTHERLDYTIHLSKHVEEMNGDVYDVTFLPITSTTGQVLGREGTADDVSTLVHTREKLARLSEQAKDSLRLKTAFMASMTHELRTPLNAIVGFTGVLSVTSNSDERAEFLRIISNGTDMLQRLINDIIEASSLDEGLTTIQTEDVDFVPVFNEICLTLRQRVQQPGVEFIADNPYESFLTTIDKERLLQVLTNFVTNAVKFTKEGHILVGYRYREHGLYFYCEDTGIGIPKDKQAVVFNRFVKLDEFVQGTGMGLSICKSIIERMDGRIGVESDGPGSGCTFWAWIPCERRLTPR